MTVAGAVLGGSLLSGCQLLGGLFGPDDVVKVSEIARAQNCATPGPDAAVQMFADADAVRTWQQGRGLALIGDQAMLPGTYVLIELGQRASSGYGLLVGPQAQIEDQRVRLHATFFSPDAESVTNAVATSPCVLVRLPAGSWQGVDLVDQSGMRRVSSATP